MRSLLILTVMVLASGCSDLPPPTPENNIVECRDLARIESDEDGSLTDQYTAQIISKQIGCPRYTGSLIAFRE